MERDISMEFSTISTPIQACDSACVVAGLFFDAKPTGPLAELDKASGGAISKLVESGDLSGRAGELEFLRDLKGVKAPRVLVVGLGKQGKFSRSAFANACYKSAKRLSDSHLSDAANWLPEYGALETDRAWRDRVAVMESARAAYRYTATKAQKDPIPPLKSMAMANADEDEVRVSAAIAAGADVTRELGNLPPNICNPAYLAEEAKRIAERHASLSVEVLGDDQLSELGMDALLAVARGSRNRPHLIVLKHSGGKDGEAPHILVGKGITFDTGGISLKPGPEMHEMKYDMLGAGSVLGTMEAIGRINPNANIIGIAAAVENMPDGDAYRPGDIITSMSGQTIEVQNTDAEGRMILCDAITYAGRMKPASMVDIATLTGACVIALGNHASAVMTQHDDLAAALMTAGDETHDRAWRLPLWDDYQQQIDTPYADMRNIGGKAAGTITAGCFLSRFATDQNWAHLDVAGTGWTGGNTDGATGRPVPLLTRYLLNQVSGS